MSPAAASYFRDGAPWILKSKALRKGKIPQENPSPMKLLSRTGREFQQNINFDVNARNHTGIFTFPKMKSHS